jgi:eukaryotic-like serine/threonine-protein kinase
VPTHRYWAFLSYSSHDRASAQWLHRALETYSVPRRFVGGPTPAGPAPRRFRPIFRDRTELPADADLGATIEKALEESAYLIVVCSPQAAKSRWVEKEIMAFRAFHGPARIFSIIASDSPTDSHLECFPPALNYGADTSNAGADRREPIAADLRPGGDGRRMARLKLLAGMLGVGLDELVRRDDQRRHRRLVAITAASFAGMAIAVALASTAFIARLQAQKQRAHAEGLIEFMLTDLRKRMEPSGKLDAMDGVGSEALKYYSAQNPHDLDAQSLARRARALRLMGEIRIQRGDLGDALVSFEQAAATTGELLSRTPNDTQIIFNHAQNVFWVGEIARQRGDLTGAESSFQQYRQLADRLTAIDPANDDWRAEVEYAEGALGVLYLQTGRNVEATVAFERTLVEADGLARRRADDLNRQIELGQATAWLADAVQKQGRLAKTRSLRESELAIYQAILTKDPTYRQAKYSTIVALQILGRLAMIEGDLDRATASFSDAAARAETLLTNERENMDLTSVVAIAQVDLGEALLARAQIGPSQAAQQRADELLAVALAHDNKVALWLEYRDRANLLQAAIAGRNGANSQALQIDQVVLNRLHTSASTASNTESFWILEKARLQTGDDLAALGRAQEAQVEWDAIVQSLANPIANYEPKLLVVLAAAESRLGHAEAARAISKYLATLSAPSSP